MQLPASKLRMIWVTVGLLLVGFATMILFLYKSAQSSTRANHRISEAIAALDTLHILRESSSRQLELVTGVAHSGLTPALGSALAHERSLALEATTRLLRQTATEPDVHLNAVRLSQLLSASGIPPVPTKTAGRPGAMASPQLPAGLQTQLTQPRELVVRMINREHDVLTSSQIAAATASHRATVYLYSLAGCCILLLLAFAFVLHRDLKVEASLNTLLEHAESHLRMRTNQIGRLNRLAASLRICVNLEDIYKAVGGFMEGVCPQLGGSLALASESRARILVVHSWGQGDSSDSFVPTECCALRAGHAHIMTGDSATLRCTHTREDRYACIPLDAQGETLGILHVHFNPDQQFEMLSFIDDLMPSVANTVATALANLQLRDVIGKQAIRDPLTGLFNRRYLEETLVRELRRAQRHQRQLAVLMIDIDHFDHFNETHGKAAGDAFLQELGTCLKASFRAEDVVCRYGGEEFALILIDVNPTTAARIATDLLERIQQLRPAQGKTGMAPVTVSGGMVLSSHEGSESRQLLRLADQRLYQAKSSGRNRIVTEGDVLTGSVPPPVNPAAGPDEEDAESAAPSGL